MKQRSSPHQLSDVKCTYIESFLRGTSVLDVGSGDGRYLSWLAQKNKHFTLVAIDKQAQPCSTYFTYREMDLEGPLELPNNSFSTIFAFDIIEHINDHTQLLHNIFTVCKPGGMLIGSVPHDEDLFLPSYNLTFYHRSDVTHKRYYTKDTLHAVLSEAGFRDITIDRRGGVNTQVVAEFFPKRSQFLIKKIIGGFRRIGIINTNLLASDLFFTAQKY